MGVVTCGAPTVQLLAHDLSQRAGEDEREPERREDERA
jgi:hypothetical protein